MTVIPQKPQTPDAMRVGVTADPWLDVSLRGRAKALAGGLGLPVLDRPMAGFEFLLALTPDRLEIRQVQQEQGCRLRPVYVDLSLLDISSNAGQSKRQPLARAVLGKRSRGEPWCVADATAGLGGDTWLFASMGCTVTAMERCSLIAAMLSDGLRRAGETNTTIASRITLVTGDAQLALTQLQPRPEVVYLDPMFPSRRKNVMEKKSMRWLRRLVGDDLDAIGLFDVAMAVATKRVVVKRPRYAQPLVGNPAVVQQGKSLRYDVYPTRLGRGRL